MRNNNYLSILNACQNRGKVSVDELVDILDLSPATIRREIKRLAEDGLVERYHGGIKISQDNQPLPFKQRVDLYKEEKCKIAKKAASFVKDNSIVLIDTGTTVAYIVDYLTAKNLLVFTNGIEIIKPLVKKKYHVNVPPGQIVQVSSTYIDFVQNLDYLDNFTFDVAFIGTNSIHPSLAFASQTASHAAILRKMVSRAKKTYILADHTKFGVLNRYTFANLNECTIITDKMPEEEGFEDADIIIAE
ncbi:MAG: DeoR/GlpR transcriptional regulator [Holdemanella sp.]|nr:DeoR/GlpR transcriptional regulator [Holdemanella sp.]